MIVVAFEILIFVFLLIRTILFHPRVNSFLCILYMVWNNKRIFLLLEHIPFSSSLSLSAFVMVQLFALLLLGFLFLVSVLDCICDIVGAEQYYKNIAWEDGSVDRLYCLKSLTSLLTFGLSRAFFRLVIFPRVARSAARSIKTQLKKEKRVRSADNLNTDLQLKKYYYQEKLSQYEQSGVLVSNASVVEAERQLAEGNLARMGRKQRKAWKAKLPSSKDVCYIRTKDAKKIPKLVIEAMSDKGPHSLKEIKYFEPLPKLNLLTCAEGDVGAEEANRWLDYFIVSALSPLVRDGTFKEEHYNDEDPLDNHTYHYVKSTKSMRSGNMEDDPRFA